MALAQQIEGAKIRTRADAFGQKVEEFRRFFQQRAPFTAPSGKIELEGIWEAYRTLDQFHHGKVTEWE